MSTAPACLRGDAAVVAERLNRACFCVAPDRDALSEALNREAGDPAFYAAFMTTRSHLFADAPVFLPQAAMDAMLRTVRAIEAVARLPAYRDAVLAWAPEIARHEFGPRGVFMGYDFHLTADGPKLIEINTNAGGAFLNAALARAQRACCPQVGAAFAGADAAAFEPAILRMFRNEWALQRGTGGPARVAIVDDEPHTQYLHPEFVLAQRFFRAHGTEAVIAEAADLRYEHGRLLADGLPVDLVYNRLVDFSLDQPLHAALRAAYLDQAVVVTPNPRVHALFADKRNLALLSDTDTLRSWGVPGEMLADLAGIPRTVLVTPQNAAQLWAARKALFFKPAGGHGSKAVYRGDKLTKGVWAEIAAGAYVAQNLAAPSARMVEIDGVRVARKTDVRLYVYDGEILLAAARLYQGQATNFRTPGGGFAPVIAV